MAKTTTIIPAVRSVVNPIHPLTIQDYIDIAEFKFNAENLNPREVSLKALAFDIMERFEQLTMGEILRHPSPLITGLSADDIGEEGKDWEWQEQWTPALLKKEHFIPPKNDLIKAWFTGEWEEYLVSSVRRSDESGVILFDGEFVQITNPRISFYRPTVFDFISEVGKHNFYSTDNKIDIGLSDYFINLLLQKKETK